MTLALAAASVVDGSPRLPVARDAADVPLALAAASVVDGSPRFPVARGTVGVSLTLALASVADGSPRLLVAHDAFDAPHALAAAHGAAGVSPALTAAVGGPPLTVDTVGIRMLVLAAAHHAVGAPLSFIAAFVIYGIDRHLAARDAVGVPLAFITASVAGAASDILAARQVFGVRSRVIAAALVAAGASEILAARGGFGERGRAIAAALAATGASIGLVAREDFGVRGVNTAASMGADGASPPLHAARCAVGVLAPDHAEAVDAEGDYHRAARTQLGVRVSLVKAAGAVDHAVAISAPGLTPSRYAAQCAVSVLALVLAAAMGAADVPSDPAARADLGVCGVDHAVAMGAAGLTPSPHAAQCAVGVLVLALAAAMGAADVPIDPAARTDLGVCGVDHAVAMGAAGLTSSPHAAQCAVGARVLARHHSVARDGLGVRAPLAEAADSDDEHICPHNARAQLDERAPLAHSADADGDQHCIAQAGLGVRVHREPTTAVMICALLCGGLAIAGAAAVKGIMMLIRNLLMGDAAEEWAFQVSHWDLSFETGLAGATLIMAIIIGAILMWYRVRKGGIVARLTYSEGWAGSMTMLLMFGAAPCSTAAPLPPSTSQDKRERRGESYTSRSTGVVARRALFAAIAVDYAWQLFAVGLLLTFSVILPMAFLICLRRLGRRCERMFHGAGQGAERLGPSSVPPSSPPSSPPGDEPLPPSPPPVEEPTSPAPSLAPSVGISQLSSNKPMGAEAVLSGQPNSDSAAAAASSAMSSVHVDDLGEWLHAAGAPSVDAPTTSSQAISGRAFNRLVATLTTSRSRRSTPAAFVNPLAKGDCDRCRGAYERILQQRLGGEVLRSYRARGRHVSTGTCRHIAIIHGIELPPYDALANAAFDVAAVEQAAWCVPDDCRRSAKQIAKDGWCAGHPCLRCSVRRGPDA